MNSKLLTGFVDRIEEGNAVLLIGEEQQDIVVIPSSYLPDGVSGGQMVSILITDDPEETRSNIAELQQLIDELQGSSGT